MEPALRGAWAGQGTELVVSHGPSQLQARGKDTCLLKDFSCPPTTKPKAPTKTTGGSAENRARFTMRGLGTRGGAGRGCERIPARRAGVPDGPGTSHGVRPGLVVDGFGAGRPDRPSWIVVAGGLAIRPDLLMGGARPSEPHGPSVPTSERSPRKNALHTIVRPVRPLRPG